MNLFFLPPDDQISSLTSADRALLLELGEAVSDRFHAVCNFVTQKLLAQCEWSLTIYFDMPILTICCPSYQTYWDAVDNIETLKNYLSRIIPVGQIKIILEEQTNFYFESEIETAIVF